MKQSAIICTKLPLDHSDLPVLRNSLSQWLGGLVHSMDLVQFPVSIYPHRQYVRFVADFKDNNHLYDFLLKYNLQQEQRFRINALLTQNQIEEYKSHCLKSTLLIKGFPLIMSYSSILHHLEQYGLITRTNIGHVHGNSVAGLVQYQDERSMLKASAWLNGSLLLKHKISACSASSPDSQDFIPYIPSTKVSISNLDWRTSYDKLYEICLNFGQISSLDYQNGEAQVEFFSRKDALNSIEVLSDQSLHKKPLKLTMMEDSKKLFIEDMNSIKDTQTLKSILEKFGPLNFVKSSHISETGFVEFSDRPNRDKALDELDKINIDNQSFSILGMEPKHLTVHVNNVPRICTKSQLESIFKPCGTIKHLRFDESRTKKFKSAMIRFENQSGVSNAQRLAKLGLLAHNFFVKRLF